MPDLKQLPRACAATLVTWSTRHAWAVIVISLVLTALALRYTATHIARLQDNTAQSIETSSLHIDLLSELKRINSHICAIAYPILESAGALSQTRIRHSRLAAGPDESVAPPTRDTAPLP